MAFFEDLGKKISETSQGVVQKTKDTAEVMRLNSAISDAEKKITAIYTKIGEIYCEKKADSAEPDFAELVAAVKELKVNINNYNEQINKLKGLIFCPNCNAALPPETIFCSLCGTRMPQELSQPKADEKLCPSCGAPVKEGMAFCTSCGLKLGEVAVQSAPTCKKCGATLQDGMKFCTTCGAMVEVEAPAPAPVQTPAPAPVVEAPAPVVEPTPVVEVPVVETPVVEAPIVEETPVVEQPQPAVVAEPAPAPIVETPVAEAPAQPQKRFCTGCGKELSPGTKFCTACGKPV